MNNILKLDLTENCVKTRCIHVLAHDDLQPINHISPLDFKGFYDWDLERNFINKLREAKGLMPCNMQVEF